MPLVQSAKTIIKVAHGHIPGVAPYTSSVLDTAYEGHRKIAHCTRSEIGISTGQSRRSTAPTHPGSRVAKYHAAIHPASQQHSLCQYRTPHSVHVAGYAIPVPDIRYRISHAECVARYTRSVPGIGTAHA
eukprot:3941771-Rhodomonas_salina.2